MYIRVDLPPDAKEQDARWLAHEILLLGARLTKGVGVSLQDVPATPGAQEKG